MTTEALRTTTISLQRYKSARTSRNSYTSSLLLQFSKTERNTRMTHPVPPPAKGSTGKSSTMMIMMIKLAAYISFGY